LRQVAVPEIPAKAAELVHAAAPAEREQTVEDVLSAASTVARPGVLPFVVSALCHGDAELAGDTVSDAIRLQPQDVLVFTKAACCAAPQSVEKIVFSACQASPVLSANIALVAYRQCPGAVDLITLGLTRARPDFRLYLEEAEAQLGANDFEEVLKKAVQYFTDATAALKK
jgi:hypothetical protein